jgi:archaemetzincin
MVVMSSDMSVLQTLTHEIGHILGLRHCQWLACLMQGSNHLEESDRRPLNVCPICLRKLQSAIGFNIVERYRVSGTGHRDSRS